MRSLVSFTLGAAAGAAAAHLLDPENGSRRRAQLRDQSFATARRGAGAAQSQAQQAAGKVQGAASSVAPSSGRFSRADDDVSLARRVETEIFRDADVPKSGVSVDVQAGVAYLRGEVPDQGWVARLGEAASQVEGITDVQNLLHTPGTPAPVAQPRGLATERFGS